MRKIKPIDKWSWDEWRENADHIQRKGWAYVSFPMESGGWMMWIYGWVRGPFGIFGRHATVSRVLEEGAIESTEHPIWNLAHIRAGLVVAVFIDLDLAFEAAEVADNVADWNAVDEPDHPGWAQAVHRTMIGWKTNAIYTDERVSARTKEGVFTPGLMVKIPAAIIENRPARLS